MSKMTPKLATALGVSVDGSWQQILEAAMEMPPSSQNDLRILWEANVHRIIAEGGTPDPMAFTHAVVDARFAEG